MRMSAYIWLTVWIAGTSAALLYVARRRDRDTVTQAGHPVARLTCEMTPAEMLDCYALPTEEDVIDVAQDELEQTGSLFEREQVVALFALRNALKEQLEARQ